MQRPQYFSDHAIETRPAEMPGYEYAVTDGKAKSGHGPGRWCEPRLNSLAGTDTCAEESREDTYPAWNPPKKELRGEGDGA